MNTVIRDIKEYKIIKMEIIKDEWNYSMAKYILDDNDFIVEIVKNKYDYKVISCSELLSEDVMHKIIINNKNNITKLVAEYYKEQGIELA